MGRVTLARPAGAFYAFFRVAGMVDSVAFAQELIARTGVGMAPGRAFGDAGEGWLRLCFAAEAATPAAAMAQIGSASCSARVCLYGYITVVAGYFQINTNILLYISPTQKKLNNKK